MHFLCFSAAKFWHNPNNFPDETAAIMWVLSYMKEGSAWEWPNEYLEPVVDGKPKHSTFESFFTTIKDEFSDPDKQATKIYKLCTITQGDHTTNKYVHTFRKAAQGSGYVEEALIEEFQCSLNRWLWERVSNLDKVPDTIDG